MVKLAKDPAVLFYYQDFLVGTEFLTDEDVGKYIRILCHQADKGSLTKKQVLSICKASVLPDFVQEKMKVDDNGLFYNKRMLEEKEKRSKFAESRRKNALGGKASAKRMEDEDININGDINVNGIPNAKKKTDETPSDFYFESIFNLYVLEFGNLLILEKWKEWVDYRTEIKHKLTKSTAEKQILFLLKQSNPAKCIDDSITNGWQGLFPQKTKEKKYDYQKGDNDGFKVIGSN